MGFIEEFYFGNIDPQLRNVKEKAAFKQDMDSLCKIENSLRERLTSEDKELFIEYVNLWGIICGDLELCFGLAELALADIEKRADEIFEDGKLPLLMGGEHLVTLGAVRAAIKKYPDMHIIHFDAHADLRDDYLGAKLSHACVMRRCHELLGDGKIHQFCIRSGEWAEFAFAKEHTDMHPFSFEGLKEVVEDLKKKNVPVYFTIDLDCMDSSVFPGTGTPEAGGVSFMELLHAILEVAKTNVIAADVNELAPMLDASGVSTATACKVVRELILAIYK